MEWLLNLAWYFKAGFVALVAYLIYYFVYKQNNYSDLIRKEVEKQMTNILKLLGLLGGIIPIILTLIKEFETPGFGVEKKKVILDSIALVYDALAEGNTLPVTKEKVLGLAGNFIDIAVAFFNVIGWFKHGNPTDNTQEIAGQKKRLFHTGKSYSKYQGYMVLTITRNIGNIFIAKDI